MKPRLAIALALCGMPLTVLAQNLTQVYQDARAYDAQYAAARYALQAGQEKLPQGRALLLPTLNFSASVVQSYLDTEYKGATTLPQGERDFRTDGYTFTLTQPLYRAQNFIQYDQAELQVKQAESVFGQANQDLIVRVAVAYFEFLGAQDSLRLVRGKKAAIAEQLAQARRNFEVGTATITDTHEAQARYDLSQAEEISALNDVEARRRALQQLTGKVYESLKPLRADIKLSPPNPNDMQAWVDLAEKQSYPVLIQDSAAQIAELEAKRAKAGHYPTLDAVATHGQGFQTGSQLQTIGSDITTSTIGLQFALPIYAGGGVSSRHREAAANAERSKQDLENARRSAAFAARQSYLAVLAGVAQVRALEQASVSSRSALDSNRLGYEVGVRINIDVLNAQQQVFQTERDLLAARYNTIANTLRLKAAGGGLREEDVEEVNRVLEP
ncbi:MAG TPA: TolC family outer membrane protein [Burkholderiales bacterium]